MNFKTIYKYLILFLFSPVYLFSQERAELSLKEALSYALQNKAAAIKAKLQIENAEYKIEETKSQLLPQLSGSGNITHNPLLQKSALPGEIIGQPGTSILVAFGQKWNMSAGVHISQNIFNQALFTGLKIAETSREFYQINSQLTNEELIQIVAENYYQVYLEKERLRVVDSSLANTKKVKEVLKGQYDNGLAKKIDLDRLDVKFSNLKTVRQQSLNAVEIQENTLKYFLGMPIEAIIYLPKLDYEIITLPYQQQELVEFENLSQYKLLESQKQMLLYQKEAFQAEYYPTLSLVGDYNYQGIGDDFPIFGGNTSDANWFGVASIGLNLKIPIFKGFYTRAKVRQADVELQSITVDLDDTKLALQLDFQNARAQLRNSFVTIENQKQNVELAKSVLKDTENNYFYGLSTLTDLLDAQNSLIASANNLNQTILDYKLAEIRLLKAKGQLTTLLN